MNYLLFLITFEFSSDKVYSDIEGLGVSPVVIKSEAKLWRTTSQKVTWAGLDTPDGDEYVGNRVSIKLSSLTKRKRATSMKSNRSKTMGWLEGVSM